jgi:hypothetical protein
VDRIVIDQKLESLRRCLARIRSQEPLSPEKLANNFDTQDIVSLNLTRAVQLAVDIGAHLKDFDDYAQSIVHHLSSHGSSSRAKTRDPYSE